MDRLIVGILAKWGEVINGRVKKRWASINGIDGEANTEDPQMSSDGKTHRLAMVFSGQKAWITEFGTGSLMEKDLTKNRYLLRYTRSNQNFNRYRLVRSPHLGIKVRETGHYYDLDGNKHYSRGGRWAGVDLEAFGAGKGKYQPRPPMYLINEEFKAALPEIREDLNNSLKEHIVKTIRMAMGG